MTDRVALITGAGSGLGRATAVVLARKGYRCVLVGRREAAIRSAADEVAAASGVVEAVVADITVPEDRSRMVERCVTAFGRLDVLVNNAGIAHQAPLLAATPEDWRRVMATNLDAMFFLAQAALPTMREQKFGRIINIGSVYGSLGVNAQFYGAMLAADTPDGPTRQVSYHTSKGGVLNLTRDLAVAVAPWGVTVNCISPGMFMTEQSEAVVDPDVIAALVKMTPAGRFGDPPEIGHAVAFLASDEAAFITGIDLKVDGGWSIWVILAGKRALVTGGAGGIGSAIVRLFAAEGAAVVIHDLPRSNGMAIAASVQGTFIAGDLQDMPAVLADVARAGLFDILINNAAIDPIGPIESYDAAAYDATQAINARAAFLLSQAVIPGMKQRGGGAIVNIISVTLSGGWTDKVPYVMSKGALLGLTRCLAREAGPAGIRVNAVSPGAIPTEMESKFWGNDRAAFDLTVIEKQPLKFRGSPEDIAEAALFLASPRSRFVTGHELHVNGGWYMG